MLTEATKQNLRKRTGRPRKYPDHPLHQAYRNCIWDAEKRSIPFLLTFEEWLEIWEDSGHLHQRGCRKGCYVMARYGDKGPYTPGNVKIITHAENIKERHLGAKRSEEACERIAQARKGSKMSAEVCARISKALKGRKQPPRSAEHCANLSRSLRGKKRGPLSEAHKRNISKGLRGK